MSANTDCHVQNLKPRLLDTLHRIPHLLNTISSEHLIKELRSICSEARLSAVGLITGLTVDFDDTCTGPCSNLQTSTLHTLLKGNTLKRMCVVIHLERHGE